MLSLAQSTASGRCSPNINRMITSYLQHGRKVLSIDQQFMDQPCIGIDNYQMFYQMTEHMITVHGFDNKYYLYYTM